MSVTSLRRDQFYSLSSVVILSIVSIVDVSIRSINQSQGTFIAITDS